MVSGQLNVVKGLKLTNQMVSFGRRLSVGFFGPGSTVLQVDSFPTPAMLSPELHSPSYSLEYRYLHAELPLVFCS